MNCGMVVVVVERVGGWWGCVGWGGVGWGRVGGASAGHTVGSAAMLKRWCTGMSFTPWLAVRSSRPLLEGVPPSPVRLRGSDRLQPPAWPPNSPPPPPNTRERAHPASPPLPPHQPPPHSTAQHHTGAPGRRLGAAGRPSACTPAGVRGGRSGHEHCEQSGPSAAGSGITPCPCPRSSQMCPPLPSAGCAGLGWTASRQPRPTDAAPPLPSPAAP